MPIGIIAELNPFHSGHESLLRFANNLPDSDGIILILSSDFTQRGSPSLTDKFTRAYTALMGGADVVIELPFMYACSQGENFAEGACGILGRLGCVSRLVFGMEDFAFNVHGLAEALTGRAFGEALRHEMSIGASYAKACSISAERVFPGSGKFLTRPNNTLALSYIMSIKRNGYDIEAVPVRREGSVSSRMIRENPEKYSGFMPEYSREALMKSISEGKISAEEKLWPLLQGLFLRSKAEDLRKIYGIDEGIEGLFLKHWRNAEGLDDFIGRCVCARYTRAHIRRCLIYMLTGLERDEAVRALKGGVPYARVLGFNERGRKILRDCRKTSSIPVITSLKYAEGADGKFFARTEQKASQLYELTLNHNDILCKV